MASHRLAQQQVRLRLREARWRRQPATSPQCRAQRMHGSTAAPRSASRPAISANARPRRNYEGTARYASTSAMRSLIRSTHACRCAPACAGGASRRGWGAARVASRRPSTRACTRARVSYTRRHLYIELYVNARIPRAHSVQPSGSLTVRTLYGIRYIDRAWSGPARRPQQARADRGTRPHDATAARRRAGAAPAARDRVADPDR